MHTTVTDAIESDQCIRRAFTVDELAHISAAGEVEGFAAMPHQEARNALPVRVASRREALSISASPRRCLVLRRGAVFSKSPGQKNMVEGSGREK